MTTNELYRWLAKLVATLPQTKVTITWGEPHFRVGEKIFGGWGQGKDGRYSVGVKLDKDKQAALVASDPRFAVAPYVGKHGWVSFYPGEDPNLGELEALVVESYCNIAPAALAAQVRGGSDAAAPAGGAPARAASSPRARTARQGGGRAAPAVKPARKRAVSAERKGDVSSTVAAPGRGRVATARSGVGKTAAASGAGARKGGRTTPPDRGAGARKGGRSGARAGVSAKGGAVKGASGAKARGARAR